MPDDMVWKVTVTAFAAFERKVADWLRRVKKEAIMSDLILVTETLRFDMARGPDIRDIRAELLRIVEKSGAAQGTLNATAVGSTGSLTTIEYEPGVVADLQQAINRLAPPDIAYEHERRWHDGNGHSHVQAALLGPSLALPIREGRLALGTWQQVVLINHDVKPRIRNVEVTLVATVQA